MQTDEGDLFTPGIFDTPSLVTPDVVVAGRTVESTYDPLHSINESLSTSNPSSQTTNETSSVASSADVKVSKIEEQLKRGIAEPRKPTPSPFQAMTAAHPVFVLDKPPPVEDVVNIEIPSTADV